ncbi:hypothetical protein NLJ89_g6674 [Agrocybe chaxingu]|uniref:CFEM domain-containing protein n=1 Tax=Agrocybe chaxingu TaxID=84603 RepID=A0A9W8JY58_9AGAR|nr:hypothetical protein NLJ89_g6674 [Agrocybe chaxingu]
MRFSTIAFTLFGAAASASASLIARQAAIPNCMLPCLANADFGDCVQTDNLCLCNNRGFVDSTTTCVLASCSGDDLQNALAFSVDLCLKVGVTLTSDAPTSTDADTATATATSPATTTGTAAPAQTSTDGAMSHGANTLAGLAAVGIIALAL